MNTTANRRATQSTVIAIHHIPHPRTPFWGCLASPGSPDAQWLAVFIHHPCAPFGGVSRLRGGSTLAWLAVFLPSPVRAVRGRLASPGSSDTLGLRPAIRPPSAASGTSRSPRDRQQRLVAQATAPGATSWRNPRRVARQRARRALGHVTLSRAEQPRQPAEWPRRAGGAGVAPPASAGRGFAAHREASTWSHHAALSRAVPAQGRPLPAHCPHQRCRHQPAQIPLRHRGPAWFASPRCCQRVRLPPHRLPVPPPLRVAAGPTGEHGVPAVSRGAVPQPWEERVSRNPPTARRA
jgi:hypothetical protein